MNRKKRWMMFGALGIAAAVVAGTAPVEATGEGD